MNKLVLSIICLVVIVTGLYVTRLPSATNYTNDEFIPDSEQSDLKKLIDIAYVRYERIRDKNDPVYRRDQHSKAHGCVNAEFNVFDTVPQSMQHGVFAPQFHNKTFPAWVRFSNAAFGMDPDQAEDGRGFAIKLLDVPGDKVMSTIPDEKSQDFILMNHPVFLIRDVADYLLMGELGEAEGDQRMRFFFPTWNPFDWRIKDGLIALDILASPPNSPVDTDYFSVSAYKLGPDNYVKYAVKRCDVTPHPNRHGDDPKLMRKNLKDILASQDVCFEFMIQPQRDDIYMPVEDLTIEWLEEDSPFVPVAKINIKQQSFDTPEQNTFCENTSFNPWHTLPAHEPVGGLNRARKAVYESIAKFRRGHNNAD